MKYEFNPENVSTVFETFEGTHELIANEPKTFFNAGANGKPDRGGIQYSFTVAEGDNKGKPVVFACNFETPYGMPQAKSVVMAALGYDPLDKVRAEKFNEDSRNWDWTVDTDNKILGEAWHKVKGMRLTSDLSVNEQVKQDGSGDITKFQQFKNWKPA